MNEYPHTIAIQTNHRTDDGGGGYTEEWKPYGTTEALVVPLSGSEYYQAQQTQNPVDYNVFLPYRDDITPDMRIVFRGRLLAIKAVLPSLIDINGDYEKLCLKCSVQT